jgi:hypothetical protein
VTSDSSSVNGDAVKEVPSVHVKFSFRGVKVARVIAVGEDERPSEIFPIVE